MAGRRVTGLADWLVAGLSYWFVALAVFAPQRAEAQATDVALGIEALARRDVRGADAAFARGAAGENVALRPVALQWRAHVAWRLRGDTAAAIRHISQALELSRYGSQVLLESARLSGARGRYAEAVRIAFEAANGSADAERRGLALRMLVELAADAVFSGPRGPIADRVDLAVLARARDTLAARVSRFHGRTSDARALIDAAAMLGDSSSVATGLQSYRALRDDGLSMSAGSDPGTLAGDLAAAGLYESAALYLRSSPSGVGSPPRLGDVPAYAVFLRATRREVERVHRRSLAGTARPGDVSRALNAQGRKLWPLLQWPKAPPEFYPAGLRAELASRFGTVISIERSREMDELHLAHRIGTYPVTVEGRAGTVVVLDGTIANGIDAWLLDGAGGRAGWVDRDTIFARRTGFTETPFRAWIALADPQSMPGELFRISRDSADDVARARRDSLGFLPGVGARLFRAGTAGIVDSLRRIGTISDDARAAAFARELFRSLTTSSIVLHESRHLADSRAGRLGVEPEDEFRAKLDEVIGAPRPRLALTAILVPNIGDASSHGQANRRVMRGLALWIRENGSAIADYDPSAPALLHLPLLSDSQIVAAFRSMRVR